MADGILDANLKVRDLVIDRHKDDKHFDSAKKLRTARLITNMLADPEVRALVTDKRKLALLDSPMKRKRAA